MPLMNPCLRDFWETKSRNKVLYGGRSSSKSHDACGRLVYIANKYKLKILCVRQFQNRITDSVYTLLKNKIDAFGIREDYKILNTSITSERTGSEFLFYGINRNIDEIKSTEDVDILYIEEAHGLTYEQWKILEPTIRKENSEVWIVFNPDLVSDFVYDRFIINTPPYTIIRKINYEDNPFLSNTMVKIIEAKKKEDHDEYLHIYGGDPKSDDDDAIIKRSWVKAAIDSHIKLNIEPKGVKTIGFDVADSGDDKNATIERYGPLATIATEWQGLEHEIGKSAIKVYNRAKEINAEVIYDSIGVGAAIGSKFKEINDNGSSDILFYKFNAGEGVRKPDRLYMPNIKNKDHFSNLKAQTWWNIADRFKATYNAVENGEPIEEDELISIDSNIEFLEKLITELTTPRKDYDNFGRVKVESKKDLSKRGIKSPNIADAFIMAYADVRTPPKKVYEVRPIRTSMPMAR